MTKRLTDYEKAKRKENRRVESEKIFLEKMKKENPEVFSLERVTKFTGFMDKMVFKTEYGDVKLSPNLILKGIKWDIRSAVNKNEYFLNMLKEKNQNAYSKLRIVGNYINNSKPILFKDEFGSLKIKPSQLLAGEGWGILAYVDKEKYLMNVAKSKNKKFEGLKIIGKYINNSTKILCETKYGLVEVLPSMFCTGSFPSILCAIDKDEYIKAKFNEVHSMKYEYSKVKYVSAHKKIIITCTEHGDFYCSPNNHLKGRGCPKCHGDLFSLEGWLEWSSLSSHFNSFKLYKIRCWNEEESFYKIGITFNSIERRFSPSDMPYEYEVLEIIESEDGSYIWNLEKELHKKHKEQGFEYIPKIKFGGMYECFSELLQK